MRACHLPGILRARSSNAARYCYFNGGGDITPACHRERKNRYRSAYMAREKPLSRANATCKTRGVCRHHIYRRAHYMRAQNVPATTCSLFAGRYGEGAGVAWACRRHLLFSAAARLRRRGRRAGRHLIRRKAGELSIFRVPLAQQAGEKIIS